MGAILFVTQHAARFKVRRTEGSRNCSSTSHTGHICSATPSATTRYATQCIRAAFSGVLFASTPAPHLHVPHIHAHWHTVRMPPPTQCTIPSPKHRMLLGAAKGPAKLHATTKPHTQAKQRHKAAGECTACRPETRSHTQHQSSRAQLSMPQATLHSAAQTSMPSHAATGSGVAHMLRNSS